MIFPKLSLELLNKSHDRKSFTCSQNLVDDWLKTKARQSQSKNLSRTKVLVNPPKQIAGFYTLAMGQVVFDELPYEISSKLPQTSLPVVKLAWLGVDDQYKGQGLGEKLLAQALEDAYKIGCMAPFCAVVLDCVDNAAKSFYAKYDFMSIPGHNLKMAISWAQLEAIVN